VTVALSSAIFQSLSYKTGLPTPPPDVSVWTLESLRGFRHALSAVIAIQTESVIGVLIPMMFLLVVRLLLKKTWIAVVITTVIGMFVFYPGSGSLGLHVALFFIPAILFWVALFRFGFLGLLVSASFTDLFRQMPLTLDLSAWYATPTIVTLLVTAAVALFAFRSTLAGRRSPAAAELSELPAG
jgi:hypothetical protein